MDENELEERVHMCRIKWTQNRLKLVISFIYIGGTERMKKNKQIVSIHTHLIRQK